MLFNKMSFKNISLNLFNSRSFNDTSNTEEHSGDGSMLVSEQIERQLQKKKSAFRWVFGVVLPTPVFGALFVLLWVLYGWEITHFAFPRGFEGYQPRGSPPFKQTGNHRSCKDTKPDILARGLMPVEMDNMTRDWKIYAEEHLPDIYDQSPALHSALVRLLEYDACSNLSITTNTKATEVKKKIIALEEIIQCNRQPQSCGQSSRDSEKAATQLISNIISLHMGVVGDTADLERLILRQARKTLTACEILRSQIQDVVPHIEQTIQNLETERNKVRREIDMNDKLAATWTAWMPWKKSSLSEYQVENKEREREEQLSIYRARNDTLSVIRKSCIELRIILGGFVLQINVQYDNWYSLSYSQQADCFFPVLPPLERVLRGDEILSDWARQVVNWADNLGDFADATKMAADRKMGRTG
ncbi:aebb7827-23b6-4972-b819-ddb13b4054db [Sclerotinia trifoliorum]|uniref:Aebb7827-23b6-4972-b819-ddb13b4054db n=1 Tax=Sclerotinia trifoliorum TaxID=28548 RepID=A0A8H2VPU4_9HELO|nr:aebb7827-23b6-4972-b819-ddb13b4054db [Sclerotinia trifoliorum]